MTVVKVITLICALVTQVSGLFTVVVRILYVRVIACVVR